MFTSTSFHLPANLKNLLKFHIHEPFVPTNPKRPSEIGLLDRYVAHNNNNNNNNNNNYRYAYGVAVINQSHVWRYHMHLTWMVLEHCRHYWTLFILMLVYSMFWWQTCYCGLELPHVRKPNLMVYIVSKNHIRYAFRVGVICQSHIRWHHTHLICIWTRHGWF